MASKLLHSLGYSAPVWSLPFRPFFLAAGAWSAVAVALWIAVLFTRIVLPSRFDPLTWHIHAMLIGFVLAAIAGFILTAIPSWTGRAPIKGARLAGLVLLWLLGRLACFFSAFLPLSLAAALDVGFPATLCLVAEYEVAAARNWRNIAIPLPIGVLGIADLLIYLETAGFEISAGLGWRLALLAVIALISAVGGRIVPAFTRNWLMRQGEPRLPAPSDRLDRVGLAALHTGLLAWVFWPASRVAGVVLLLSAALTIWRLARWRGFATLTEPLLTILHVGYAWVAIGAGLLGAALLSPSVPEAAAIHAFTAGAIGTMVLAVMTRVTRGHTGRPLEADRPTVVIYALIVAAGIVRVIGGFSATSSLELFGLSGVLWIASYLLFLASYGKLLWSQ